jgi:oligoendopeptidase F
VYENSTHTIDERTEKWMEILNEFSTGSIDYSGLEEYRKIAGNASYIYLKFRSII